MDLVCAMTASEIVTVCPCTDCVASCTVCCWVNGPWAVGEFDSMRRVRTPSIVAGIPACDAPGATTIITAGSCGASRLPPPPYAETPGVLIICVLLLLATVCARCEALLGRVAAADCGVTVTELRP